MKRNKLALLSIVFCILSGRIQTNAQSLSKLEYEVSEFCKRMQVLNGALYIDTTNIVCDTVPISVKFKPELVEKMGPIVKELDMKCREFSFTNIYKDFERVYISPESFAYDTIPLPGYTEYEINYSIKSDSIFRSLWDRTLSEKDSFDSFLELRMQIENLLVSSSNNLIKKVT